MTRYTHLLFVLAATAFVAGCETGTEPEAPTSYPITGQECTPEDPVKDIDVNALDCAPKGI